jgi:site-specific DNA-cytosine methylase
LDKYAIQVTQANYPDTVQLGDVTKWREWGIDWSSIDLLMGGSPCQGFSFAGKGLAFDDPRSKLFFVYVDILNHIKSVNPSVKFLLENVKMKKEHMDVITDYLGVQPVFINSALVSAQNRQRWYWANWEFSEPEDKGIMLADIIESGAVDRNKSYCIDASYYKGGSLKNYLEKSRRQIALRQSEKRLCVFEKDDNRSIRKLTPIECERLQTVPDNYTNHVSNTQRYKMLGNGWTVDVIAHIFMAIERSESHQVERCTTDPS